MNTIGIRHEDKYKMERRAALTPAHVKELIEQHNLRVLVQSSPKRVFTDDEYRAVGAEIVNDLSEAQLIFGVKEMPIDFFEEEKTYVFFSHTIKGQEYNMPLLKRMIEKRINLIEFEKIADDQGRRLIFFGRFAGLAGMINSLWSLGERWKRMGYETPFLHIKQAHHYHSLEDAIHAVSMAGSEIEADGLPEELSPLTIGITGYGNVSKGAQEILSLLPLKEISPEELLQLKASGNYDNKTIYKTVFKEEHISRPKDPAMVFELQDYYHHPEKYENNLEQYIPELSVLMNCMYWDPRYPRIITKDYLADLYKNGNPKLTVIGDITCDPDGSIEATHMGTYIEDPVYVYNPFTRKPTMGFDGDGLLIMAVDILPSELPRESSQAFGDALVHFVPDMAAADYHVSFEELKLPAPIKRAMILHHGRFTPDFEYMQQYL
jgi:alpha-aminoadipic semialdehyde synthase